MNSDATSTTNLAERLQRLEDRFAIMDLVAEYCAGIDSRDLDRFVGCFTSDAVMRSKDGVFHLRGREAIHEYYTRRFKDYGMTFHYPHSHTVVIDAADSAHGVVTGHAEMALGDDGWLAAFRYTDRYRRENDRWLFAGREHAYWYYMRLADLPKGMAGDLRKHYRGELMPAELPESFESFQAWR